MKILIINGPNLNFIEKRKQNFYGSLSLDEIKAKISLEFPSIEFYFYQSNNENDLINEVHTAPSKYDGLIINPGAFSHSSIALRDALEFCKIPKIEVHLSNLYTRDKFRYISITAAYCDGYIAGFKYYSYILAVQSLINILIYK